MAKNSLPALKNGSGALSKVVTLLVVIAIGVLVVKYPADAARWVRGLGDVIDGIVTFVRAVFG